MHAGTDDEDAGRRHLARGRDLAGELATEGVRGFDHRTVAGDVGHGGQHIECLRTGDTRNRVEREGRDSGRTQLLNEFG